MKHLFTAPPGHRNYSLAMWALVVITVLGIRAGDKLPEMGDTFKAVGFSVGLIIGARAANKWACKKNGGDSE